VPSPLYIDRLRAGGGGGTVVGGGGGTVVVVGGGGGTVVVTGGSDVTTGSTSALATGMVVVETAACCRSCATRMPLAPTPRQSTARKIVMRRGTGRERTECAVRDDVRPTDFDGGTD